jgi:hypothetical protein
METTSWIEECPQRPDRGRHRGRPAQRDRRSRGPGERTRTSLLNSADVYLPRAVGPREGRTAERSRGPRTRRAGPFDESSGPRTRDRQASRQSPVGSSWRRSPTDASRGQTLRGSLPKVLKGRAGTLAPTHNPCSAALPAMPALPASLDVEPGDAAHGAERDPETT